MVLKVLPQPFAFSSVHTYFLCGFTDPHLNSHKLCQAWHWSGTTIGLQPQPICDSRVLAHLVR